MTKKRKKSDIYDFLPEELTSSSFNREAFLGGFKLGDDTLKLMDLIIFVVLNGPPNPMFGTGNGEVMSLGTLAGKLHDSIYNENKGNKSEKDCWLCTTLMLDEIKYGVDEFVVEKQAESLN